MQMWQDILIQALLSLFLFVIALRLLKILIRKSISSELGEVVLQSLIFIALFIAFVLFKFQFWELIGAVLVFLAITTTSMHLQETTTERLQFERIFGERVGDILSEIPVNVRINEKALNRFLITLRGRNAIYTHRAKTTISMRRHPDTEVPYILFDAIEHFIYDDKKDIEAFLVWQVIPSWIYPTSYRLNNPLLPLEYGSPVDKWKVAYFPAIKIDHQDLWQKIQDNIEIRGTIHDPETKEWVILQWKRQINSRQEEVNGQLLSYSYPVFTATAHLGKRFRELRVETRNIPHPIFKPSLYFYVWDICDRWEIELSCGDTGYKVLGVTIMTNYQAATPVEVLNRGEYARVVLEARQGSILVPEDAVVFYLTSPLHVSQREQEKE
jgi:uncharacterized membrane protein YedE/YeeE